MNYYSEAIEILSKDRDWKAICIQLSKDHPKFFTVSCGKIIDSWQVQARIFLSQGKKIQAIKHCRNITGLGLRESKEAVEAL